MKYRSKTAENIKKGWYKENHRSTRREIRELDEMTNKFEKLRK